ncbi:hypothetical protein C2G38_2180715 [Gigaspora rosea]|uniref:Uncharacterized protein n=1 Tax=Gigaspora rosea TaxID=44941 RepID=A0A397VFY7_9GLOM|nr:hypothetical protein C2G38_2180715 [Gigaspora rosea]
MVSLFIAFCFAKTVTGNDKFVALVQIVSISCSEGDRILTPGDLPESSLLLIYTASVVPNFYIPDNRGGHESFMMACHLYNGVTNNRYIDSKVIVSYTNEHNRYTSMKNNLKKQSSKVASQEEIDTYLNSIEEKYATFTSQLPQKKQKIDL